MYVLIYCLPQVLVFIQVFPAIFATVNNHPKRGQKVKNFFTESFRNRYPSGQERYFLKASLAIL
jgi:hypothetical protein